MPKIEAVWEKRVRMQRLVQVVSVVALILYFVFLSSLISYSLLLTREKKALRGKIGIYEERVKELESVESKQVILKSKLKELLRILKFEEKPEEVLGNLEALSLEGVKFSEINYTDGSLRLRGGARDAVVLDEFVRNLEDEGKNLFSQAAFNNINRTAEGDYIFDLLLLK